MPTSKPRFSVTVDEITNQKIEDYWFNHRCRNKNTAVNEILQIGLEAEEKKVARSKKHIADHAEREIHN